MARRMKRKSSSRRTTNISITGVAQSYIVGSAMTKAFTGNNLMDFVTGRGGTNPGVFAPGADGGQNISLPELLGIRRDGTWSGNILGEGHFGNKAGRFTYKSAIKHNLKTHGFEAAVTAVAVPVGVRVFRRLSSRSGVTRYANQFLKMTGLPVRM